jgi:hypothetical protein
VQSAPNPAHATFTDLNSVSCVSAGSCEAGGSYWQVDTSNDTIALAEGWNGHAWLLQRAVTPPGATENSLGSVSCVSASFCEAVGGGPSGENAAVWNASTWTPQPTADGPSEVLSAVSCSAANACEAVGSAGSLTLAEAWNGSTWALQSTPSPSGFQSNSLNSVSCTSAGACTAVGDSQTNGQVFSSTLGEVWNSTA